MIDRWIVFGGWATPPSVLAPLFGPLSKLIDVDDLMPSLVRNGVLRSDWEAIIIEMVSELAPDRLYGCAGWSTGSLLAYAAATRLQPEAAVFISSTPSFRRRPGFPFGQKAAVLRAMREKMSADPADVLRKFYEQWGMAASPLLTSPLSPLPQGEGTKGTESQKRQLIYGLHFLEQATVLPVTPLPCPSLFLHGRNDLIVPFQAGKNFCENAGGRFVEYEGGHAFFMGREEEIAGVVKEFGATHELGLHRHKLL